MRSRPAAAVTENLKQSVATVWLIKIGASYCYTDSFKSIDYGGDTYVHMDMQIPKISVPDDRILEGIELKLSSVDLQIPTLILNDSFKEAEVHVHLQWYDADGVLLDTEVDMFSGKVEGRPGFDELWATLKIAPQINPLTQRCPRRRITRANFSYMPKRYTRFIWGSTVTVIEPADWDDSRKSLGGKHILPFG